MNRRSRRCGGQGQRRTLLGADVAGGRAHCAGALDRGAPGTAARLSASGSLPQPTTTARPRSGRSRARRCARMSGKAMFWEKRPRGRCACCRCRSPRFRPPPRGPQRGWRVSAAAHGRRQGHLLLRHLHCRRLAAHGRRRDGHPGAMAAAQPGASGAPCVWAMARGAGSHSGTRSRPWSRWTRQGLRQSSPMPPIVWRSPRVARPEMTSTVNGAARWPSGR